MNPVTRRAFQPSPQITGTCERLVLFDAESLLIDPTQGMQQSLRRALADLGLSVPGHGFRHWSLRTPLRDALAILMNTRDVAAINEASARYFRHYDDTGRFRGHLRPGSVSLLSRLAADARFELHYLTSIGAESAARLLDVYGIQHFPRSIVTCEQPDCPGIRLPLMKHVVECSGRPPSAWILLSDHPMEILTARDLHLHSIALGYGRAPLPTLFQLGANGIAGNLPDVHAELMKLANSAAACPTNMKIGSMRVH